jgi:hypothetical protein
MRSKSDASRGKKGRRGYRWLSYVFIPSVLAAVASLVIHPGFARQRAAVDNLSPGAAEGTKNPAYEKFDSHLARILDAWRNAREGRITKQEAEATIGDVALANSLPAYDDKVEVWITYDKASSIAEADLLAAQIEKDDHYAVFGNYVQAFAPVSSLEFISSLPGVLQVSVPPTGQPLVVSEGVSRAQAQNFFSAGFNGQGVKVAILDLGFSGYGSLIGSELPSNVTVRSFYNSTSGNGDITGGGQKHGTACAEIVHDMAPGAQLYLVNYNSVAELNAAVQYLMSQGVKVISHSVGFFNTSFYDGRGPVSEVVSNARASGVLWVNSGGNYARRHWEGFFSDTDGDDFNEFSTGLDETINITASAGDVIRVYLTWDDWNLSTNDYDLYLYFGSPLQAVASSAGYQTGLQNPTESISYQVPQTGTYHVVIKRPFFAGSRRFELFSSTHDLSEHNILSTSLVDPAVSVNSFTVGAMRYNASTVEPFSSIGPTTNGTRKPDIAGPDGVLTSSYGTGGFLGTSAAAPHVAGAAALVLSQNSSKTASEVQATLQSNAVDYGPSGADNIYGYGMLRLPTISTITVGQGAPNPQLFIDAYNRNNLSAYVVMPPLNAVHRWDCSTCSPASPSWGKGLIQDFNDKDGVSHDALMQHDGVNFVALIYGGMWTKFIALGGLNYDAANNRMLGYPIADRNCSDYNAACFADAQLVSPFGTSYHYQRFQGGALVLHKSGARINQTYEVHGAIRTRWQDLGGPGGSYGLPIIDEYAWQSKRRSDFEGGSICYNPSTNQTEPGCTTPPAQVSVTFQTSPSGRSYTVDGVTYTSSQTFTWNSGSSHTVSTTSPQSGAAGTRYVWGNWSDGGAISHTVAPTSNATYTANFATQHFLTTSAGSGGSVGPASGWYNAGQAVTVTATPNSGFSFGGWTGSGPGSFTGATNPANVTMNGPVTQTASFTQNGIQVTVQTSPAGRSFTVDGGTYTAAQTFVWVAGSAHTIGTTSPQSGAQGTRYVWAGWSDGGAISHTVTPGGNATYTANFTAQHFLTMNAGAGGVVSPASNWYNAGQSVSVSATPNAGFGFSGWTGSGNGSYTGSNNPATVLMNGPVTETAGFTATNPCGTDTVWAESTIPTGATAYPSTDGWNWVATNPAPFSGSQSHKSALATGFHDHYFVGATNALQVRTGDVLFAYVYLDPANPPSELMLAWNDGVWGYRAYWGANLIGVGTDGTASRRYMGPLPPAGQWVRLEVPAALVGLEGHNLTGMSFILFNGRATWGRVGRACTPVPTSRYDRVWVGDVLPAGATPLGSGEGWNWVGANPSPYSGGFSHQSANVAGYHDHYFVNAVDTLPVNAGDTLIAYVYLDPASPPSEIMLSWNDGTWGYRAYWGANLINAGTDGTASRRYMGPLPAAGRWARLEVPAALVGLEGRTLRGMSFIQYNGRAAWDHAGKTSEQVWVEDAVPAGAAVYASNDGWNWITTNPAPYSGSSAHQSAVLAGVHDHFFLNATSNLAVNAGDVLFAYVYLDPANPPSEVMLSWNDGVWGYRAYWGANLINAGTDGTASRRYMGPLPAAGQWARLGVPAALVGLEGHSLTGMSFLAYNGRVTWDRAGKMGGGRVNHALAANGAAASALSTTPDADFFPSTFPASGAINGNRRGDDWGRGGAWRGSTGVFPNWLEISFQGPKAVSEIDIFTTQDGLENSVEPSLGMTFTQYGLTDFQVQYWDGSSWQPVPGGNVSGNNKVWRQLQFATITTSKIRIFCNAGLANAARIVEVEAWGN